MNKKLFKLFLFIPLSLVLISILVETFSKDISQLIKIIALLWIAVSNIIFNRNTIFFHLTLIVAAYICLLGLYREVEFFQLMESGTRYLIPILVITYGFQLKLYKKTVLIVLLSFILLNDIYQLINWVIPPIFNDHIAYKINRATGFVGYFDLFGFINIIGLFIINQTNLLNIKRTWFLLLSFIFSVFLIWSLSLKMIVIFIVYVLIFNRKLLLFTLPVLPIILIYKDSLISNIKLRIDRYIFKPQSARSESYRVIKDYFNDFLVIGHGPGSFGGPVSTRNQSVLYEKYNFNWFGEESLTTTDTYYPHLFVELGILFGILYLFIALVLPIILSKNVKSPFLIITVISVNSIFSFALNSLSYCIFSFMLIYILSDAKYCLDSKKILKQIIRGLSFKK